MIQNDHLNFRVLKSIAEDRRISGKGLRIYLQISFIKPEQ
jgi:hypothetical protein